MTLRGAELSERVRSRGACFADRKTLYWIPSEMSVRPSVRPSVCRSEVISSRAYFAAQNKNGQNESTITRSVEWFLISLTSLRSLSGFSSKLRKVDLQSQLQSLQSFQRHQSMRLRFIYILSVLVFIEADENVSEPRETVNPTTPIHTKRSAESSKLGEISPAIFHAQEVRTAEGTKNIINSFSTPGGTHFQYEIEGTPVGGESSEQRRARKKANTQRKERVELRAGAKKGYLPSIEKSTKKKT